MKVYPFALASAAVLGTAAVLVASGTAAQPTTSQQLIINQRISQAAVRRSNSALNYLAPIRTTTTDAANTGKNGVTPLSKVPGAGQGWPTTAIANNAITQAKIANGAIGPKQMAGYIAPTKIGAGQTVKIWSSGVLTLNAVCTINAGGNDSLAIQLVSTQAGAAAEGEQVVGAGGAPVSTQLENANIGANAAFTVLDAQVPTGTAILRSLDGGGIGPDGTSFTAELNAGVNLAGIGANGGATSCTVSGTVNG